MIHCHSWQLYGLQRGRAVKMLRHPRRRAVLVAALLGPTAALDNGKGITPPRGWRSWDGAHRPLAGPAKFVPAAETHSFHPSRAAAAFENSVNQTLQTSQVDALVDRSRTVDGKTTSLLDLVRFTLDLPSLCVCCCAESRCR